MNKGYIKYSNLLKVYWTLRRLLLNILDIRYSQKYYNSSENTADGKARQL